MFDGIELPPQVTWSVMVGHPGADVARFEQTPDVECATASIGKTLLLITAAEAIVDGTLDPLQPVSRQSTEQVADSGIWQHLTTEHLPVSDLCALVGAVSDNLATNALVGLVGLDSVRTTARALGLERTALHDIVRDARTSEHPAALSTGTARELTAVCWELAEPARISPDAAGLVRQWLALNTDLSMVAGGFGLDPLAHGDEDRGFAVWNKTGTKTGVRCDIGSASFQSRQLTWAVLANWREADASDPTRDDVLAVMRRIGQAIRDELVGAS